MHVVPLVDAYYCTVLISRSHVPLLQFFLCSLWRLTRPGSDRIGSASLDFLTYSIVLLTVLQFCLIAQTRQAAALEPSLPGLWIASHESMPYEEAVRGLFYWRGSVLRTSTYDGLAG